MVNLETLEENFQKWLLNKEIKKWLNGKTINQIRIKRNRIIVAFDLQTGFSYLIKSIWLKKTERKEEDEN